MAHVPGMASLAIRELMHGPRRDGRVIGAASDMLLAEFPTAAEPAVVVLSRPEAFRLPNSLITPSVPGDVPAGTHAQAGDGGITIGDTTVLARRWWDPVPVVGPLSRARLEHGAALLARLLHAGDADAPGLAGHPGPAALAVSCGRGDLAGAVEQAEALTGLGPGLVPAGDAILCGLLLALRLLGGAIPGGTRAVWMADWLGAAVTAYARERTVPLGSALLHCAARGQAPAEISALLQGVAGDEPAETAARRLLTADTNAQVTKAMSAMAWGVVAGCRAARALSVS
jgi:hypothetical protein